MLIRQQRILASIEKRNKVMDQTSNQSMPWRRFWLLLFGCSFSLCWLASIEKRNKVMDQTSNQSMPWRRFWLLLFGCSFSLCWLLLLSLAGVSTVASLF